MEHTPRPWSVGTGLAYNVCSELADTEPQSIVCENIDSHADARLIAAAPNLLAALEDVIDDMERIAARSGPGPDRRLANARAAIKAARNA